MVILVILVLLEKRDLKEILALLDQGAYLLVHLLSFKIL